MVDLAVFDILFIFNIVCIGGFFDKTVIPVAFRHCPTDKFIFSHVINKY